jgi:CDP-ribitol ribitolphosphotransferase
MKILTKQRKKIVYLSRQSNEKSMDMRLLEEEISKRYPEYEQVFRLKMIDSGLKALIDYGIWLIGDMMHIATAEILVLDTYSIPVSCLKHRKTLKVVQIWHALGAVKKFGWQSVGKAEGRSEAVSRILQMHANYDIVAVPSKATARFYSEAFHTPMKNMRLSVLPHVDMLLDGKSRRDEFIEDNREWKDKMIVLYLPTFRDEEEIIVESLRREFERVSQLKLVVSPHPLSKVVIKDTDIFKDKYSVFDLMKIADCIITDYSACAFEASLLEKPLYFYTPDYDRYKNSRGLNIDLKEEMGRYTFEDPKKLVEDICGQAYDNTDLMAFQCKYIEQKEHCTEKMAELICKNK